MAERTPPTETLRHRMLGHIRYEFRMAANGLEANIDESLASIHQVLALEAGLGHLRALLELLVGRPKRHSGDIWPTDYAPHWSVSNDEAEAGRAHLKAIDGWLAHLSLERARDAPPRWIASDAAAFIEQVAQRWAREVDDAELSAHVARLGSAVAGHVDRRPKGVTTTSTEIRISGGDERATGDSL